MSSVLCNTSGKYGRVGGSLRIRRQGVRISRVMQIKSGGYSDFAVSPFFWVQGQGGAVAWVWRGE